MSNFLRLTLCLLLSAFCLVRAADNCPDCDVTEAREAQYDRLLNLTPAQQKTALGRHLVYGLPVPLTNGSAGVSPAPSGEHLLVQKDYLTWYDDDLRVPLWVAYRLTKANIIKQRERLECFRPDPRLSAEVNAACNDYFEPIFDQGHLAPNADFKGTESMMINTYLYSNMAPQFGNFNRYTWERLEERVRMWVEKRGDLHVITGAVFDQNGDGQRDADTAAKRVLPHQRVAIPTHFYKIIINKKTFAANDTIAILLPHDEVKHTGTKWEPWITQHLTTIGNIQRVTGLNFLPKLSATKRTELENFKAAELWAKE